MKHFREICLCSSILCILNYITKVSIRFASCTVSSQKKAKRYQQYNWKTKGFVQRAHTVFSCDILRWSSPLCLEHHKSNVIVFRLNTALCLKVKDSYMFRLAVVAIIRLNMKNKVAGILTTAVYILRSHTYKDTICMCTHVKDMQF
jgi:hypothetical protein